MKKRILSMVLVLCLMFSIAPMAMAKTFDYDVLPDYLAEQDEGLYIAAQKISESGYYLLSPMASGTTNGYSTLSTEGASESNYHVYVDLDNKQITLNNAAIEIATPETNTVDNKPDMSQNPVGVLCETRGTASSDSGASTAFQTLNGYSLVTAGIAVLNQTGDWTITLVGSNSIDIDSKFAAPNRNAHLAMPVYGIYVPDGALTIQGAGTLDADVTNNQNCRSEGLGLCMPTTGVYANGLEISEASVDISAGSDRAGALNLSLYYPNDSGSYFGAVVSTGDLEIDDGAEVSVSDNLNWSTGVTAVGDITITGEETSVEVETSGAYSYALGVSSVTEINNGTGKVTIDSGTVTVTTTGGGSVGIAGSELTISGESTEITVSVSGDDSTGLAGATMTVSEADVTVTAEGEYSQAVSGTVVELSTGSYNTEIPEEYLSDGAAVVNGSVTEDIPAADEITAFIGSSLFTGEDGGNLAIAAVPVTGGEVWLNVDTSADKTGLKLGNKVTIYIAKGKTYSGTFSGEDVVANVTADGQETKNGVTYDKYLYEMIPDAATAPIKVISADGTERYYNDFGTYSTGASSNLQNGDTIILLADMDFTETGDDLYVSKSVTLDLNGKSITSTGTAIEVSTYNSTVLTIIDSSDSSSGSVTVNGTGYVYAVKGPAVIKGGTFTAEKCVYGGTGAAIEGGVIKGGIEGKWKIRGGNLTDAYIIKTSSNAILTDIAIGGSGLGKIEGTDDVNWMLTPNGDADVTINGESWKALTLTISGTGFMNGFGSSTSFIPWYGTREQITRVVIGDGITGIDNYALQELGDLNSLDLGNTLTQLNNQAFNNTRVNGEVTIPSTLATISGNPFYNSQVTAYKVADGNNSFKAEDGVLFSADGTALVAYPDASQEFVDYSVPNTVTGFVSGAFIGADLKSLTLPDNESFSFKPAFSGANVAASYNIGIPADKENYRFGGWYTDVAYTNKIAPFAGYVYLKDADHSSVKTVYAKWVSDITLDANGGTLTETSLEVAHGQAIGTFPEATRDGFSLVGWNTQPDGNGTAITANTVPAGHTTYYAIWGLTPSIEDKNVVVLGIPDAVYTGSPIEPVVYYTVDGGERQIAENVTYENNTNVGTATAKFTIDGTEVTATFNIVKATYDTSSIAFESKSFSYDGQPHYLEVTGLPEGVTVTYEGNGQADVKSGGYTVTAKFTVPAGYNEIADMTAKLTINRATVKFVVDDKTMHVGESVPEPTYQVISQVTGEPVDYDFGITPELTCSADGNTAGNYAITISGITGGNKGNYFIPYGESAYENGTLTVGMKILDAGAFFANSTVTYDGKVHKPEITVDGTLPESFSVAYTVNGEPFTGATNAGTYEVTATVTSTDPAYEAIEPLTATLEIKPATVTITADDVSIYVRGTIPALTYTVDGLLDGDELTAEPTLTCDADVNSVGTYDIVPSGGEVGSNYVLEYVNGTLTVRARPVYSGDTYSVTTEKTENGSVKVSPSYASPGSTVTVTVDPDDGYQLDELVVFDKNGIAVDLTKKSDNQYTFKMPSGKVTVEATFVEALTENPFVDVAEDAYYYDAVLWAVENGITNGTSATTFSPDATCTRGQVVTFLWRAAGCPEPKSTEMPFTDVAANSYYYDAVLWAVENGITNGTGADTFSPNADCTRGQIVTFLWRSQGSEDVIANNPFVDVADGAYYEDAVLWAVANDITNGTGANTFSPDADCTRGQIVTFLYRCLAD